MARGAGPRQPRWARQGFGVGRPKPEAKSGGRLNPVAAKQKKKSSVAGKSVRVAKAAVWRKPTAAVPRAVSKGSLPRGYNPLAPERVAEIIKRLDATYPKATCALHHKSAWELLVATILSAQCTDVRVNLVTPIIFAKYPTLQHFAALQPEELEPDIRSTGFFRNKAKSVVGAARKIVNEFGGEVPDEMAKLLTVPGAARKTANVVLGTWFHKNEGLVVDTHVQRITWRLELTRQDHPVAIEQDLMRIIPREKWTDFSHQVIWHGRKLCLARSPKCVECPLENICHAADKTWSTVEIHKSARWKP
jgi:endonuclease III